MEEIRNEIYGRILQLFEMGGHIICALGRVA